MTIQGKDPFVDVRVGPMPPLEGGRGKGVTTAFPNQSISVTSDGALSKSLPYALGFDVGVSHSAPGETVDGMILETLVGPAHAIFSSTGFFGVISDTVIDTPAMIVTGIRLDVRDPRGFTEIGNAFLSVDNVMYRGGAGQQPRRSALP